MLIPLRLVYRWELTYVRHNTSANSPTGIYRCDIPTNDVHDSDDISVRDTVYVGLYIASGGMRMRRVTVYGAH